jgi:hypothetical protein
MVNISSSARGEIRRLNLSTLPDPAGATITVEAEPKTKDEPSAAM